MSARTMQQVDEQAPTTGQEFNSLIRNKNFVLTIAIYVLIFCVNNGLGVNLTILLSSWNYNSVTISLLAMLTVFVGAICCFLWGAILDKTKKFLVGLRVITAGACLQMLFGATCLSEKLWTAIVFQFFAGLLFVPIVPICFTFAGEVTYPASAPVMIGMITCTSNLTFFLVDFGFMNIVNHMSVKASKDTMLLWSSMGLLGFICTFFMTEDLRRTNAARKNNILPETDENRVYRSSLV